MPSYLLPPYEEVVDLPVLPPPPYTPLYPTSPPVDPEEESPPPLSTVPILSNSDTVNSAGPEIPQSYIHSAYNPNKDLTPGRYRRFTGDSGIEVCDGNELLDQHGFMEREEETEEEGKEEMRELHNHWDPQNFEENHVVDDAVVEETVIDTESPK